MKKWKIDVELSRILLDIKLIIKLMKFLIQQNTMKMNVRFAEIIAFYRI